MPISTSMRGEIGRANFVVFAQLHLEDEAAIVDRASGDRRVDQLTP
jgi:hypothetical protein